MEEVYFDVRTKDEYELDHVKGCLHLDCYSKDFIAKVSKLDKNKKYLVYCESGGRSFQVAFIMRRMGFHAENAGGLKDIKS